MFRVYDKKRKKFITEDVLVDKNGDLYMIGKRLFGEKLTYLHQDRYVFQKAIELNDKNNIPIYIGDYLEAKISEDKTIFGLVTFAPELSAYIILCFESEEYFTLGESVCDLITVVGNVFDDLKKGNKNGEEAN